MNTFFKLRNALIFAFAGLAALFIAVGCGGDDGDEGGGTNKLNSVSIISLTTSISASGTTTLTANPMPTGDIASQITYKWEITSGTGYATLSATSGESVSIIGNNTTNQNKSVTVKVTASYEKNSVSGTKTITVLAKGSTSSEALTGVSISGSSKIEAAGNGTLTATPTCTSDITSQITYNWVITSGSEYATLSATIGKSVTIRGNNTTNQDKNVTVKVTASYNSTTVTNTHTFTVAAVGVPVANKLTGLELVPSTFTVACDGQITLVPKVTYTGTLAESDFTSDWQITSGSKYAELIAPMNRARGVLTFTGSNTRILKANNTTDSQQTVEVSVTVSAGEVSLIESCAVTVKASIPAEGTISLTDTPTGYAGTGSLSYKTSGVTPVTINATDSDAIVKLKNAVKNGNAIVYINGMIDATYNSTYGGSMLPSSYTDNAESSPLGKFIAAKTNNTYKSWDAWRLAYAAACDVTSHYTTGKYTKKDKGALVAGTNNATLDNYQIALASAWKSQIQIRVGSNTTIIGLTNNSGIKGGTISISDASNIIIRNLLLQDAFDPFPHHEYDDGWNAEYDCITVQNKNDHIWIDHCTFEDTISVGWAKFAGVKTGSTESAIKAYPCNASGTATTSGYEMWQTYDGLCDIKGKTTNVTVSYCVFRNHDKTMLLGSDDDEEVDGSVLDNTAKSITLHHNYFDSCVQRLPFVRTANIHIYNNYFSYAGTNGYDQKASIQIRAKAWVISEYNNFGTGISYRYKGDNETKKKGYTSATKLYDENNEGVSRTATEEWTTVTEKPFTIGYTSEYDNASDLPTILPANAGAGVWTVQQ